MQYELIHYLPRTSMILQALEFILKTDKKFKLYTMDDYNRIEKTRVYNPSVGTTSKEWELLCNDIDTYLDKNYIMTFKDITTIDDDGSREEIVNVYSKKQTIEDMLNNKPITTFYR